MLPSSAVTLALAFLVAAAPPSSPEPVAETVTLLRGEPLFLRVPGDATLLILRDWIVRADRVPDGFMLSGLRAGSTLAYLSVGGNVRLITLQVEDAAARAQAQRSADEALESQVSVKTGGVVNQGLILVADNLPASGPSTQEEHLELRGKTKDFSYFLSAWHYNQFGVGLVQNPYLQFDMKRFHLLFGNVVAASEFQPLARSLRKLETTTNLGPVDVELGARGPSFSESLFAPEAWRVRTRLQLGDEGTAGAGLIAASGAALPFLQLGFRRKSFGAEVSAGAAVSQGSVEKIASASLYAEGRGCRISGDYSTGLIGPASTLLQDYAATVRNTLLARGSCRQGRGSFYVGVRRGDQGLFVDPAALVILGGASYGTDRISIDANGAWTAAGTPDLRNLLQLLATYRAGGTLLTASAYVSRPIAYAIYSEQVRAERKIGRIRAALSLGATHERTAPRAVQASIDLTVPFQRGNVGAAVTAGLDGHGAQNTLLYAHADWSPVQAIQLSAIAQVDPQHVRDSSSVRGALTYLFGDELPRDPFLAFARASSVRVQVFLDENGDGIRQEGEPGLAGVEVCVDGAQCVTTNADGTWDARGLTAGVHWVSAKASQPTARATSPSSVALTVGGYGTPRAAFGFRFRGALAVRAFIDLDGDGKREEGEPWMLEAQALVEGPGLHTLVELSSPAEISVASAGTFKAGLDPLSLPPGYAAGAPEEVTFETLGKAVLLLPVLAQRSVSGRVCLDANENGLCEPDELGIGLVHVQSGEREAVADLCGEFLLPLLPAGEVQLTVPEADLPGGVAQLAPAEVKLGPRPVQLKSVSVPLSFAGELQRGEAVEVDWPRKGKVSAVELGGALFDASPLRTAKRLSARTSGALLVVAGLARRPRTRVLATVSRDPNLEAVSPKLAAQDAAKLGEALRKALGLAKEKLTLQTGPPSSCTAPVIELRVVQLP